MPFPANTPRRLRRHLAAVSAGIPLTLAALLPLPSQGASAQRHKERIDRRIEAVQGKLGRKRGTERVLASDITGYTHRINRLGARISTLRARVVRVQAQLEREQAELARIQERLRQERARLARLRARLIVTQRVLADRLVEIYESDRPDLLTVVLNAKGFADLLERGDFMHRISAQDQHIVTLDIHFVDRLFDPRSQRSLSGPKIELPAVPRASDCGPFDGAVGERASLMRANPVDRRDHTIDIIERVDPAFELDFLGSSRGEFVQGRQLDEARHVLVSHPIPGSASPFAGPRAIDPIPPDLAGTGSLA